MDELQTNNKSDLFDFNKLIVNISHIISDVFSPILLPTYATVIALWLTNLKFLPLSTRVSTIIGIAFITAIIPSIFIVILMKIGKIKDFGISDRKERTTPYIVSTLCYLCAAIYTYIISAPIWLILFFVAASVTSLVSLIITKFWKISAHTAAASGLAAIVFWLSAHAMISNDALFWTSCTIIITGFISSVRLILNKHTMAQVVAGAALGFTIEFAILSII